MWRLLLMAFFYGVSSYAMNVQPLTIEQAESGHVLHVEQLVRDVWYDKYTVILPAAVIQKTCVLLYNTRYFTDLLRNKNSYCLIAKHDNRVIGMISSEEIVDGEVMITHCYVAPVLQRRGIATSLVRELVKHYTTAKTVAVRFPENNELAFNFFKKMNFKVYKKAQHVLCGHEFCDVILQKKVNVTRPIT